MTLRTNHCSTPGTVAREAAPVRPVLATHRASATLPVDRACSNGKDVATMVIGRQDGHDSRIPGSRGTAAAKMPAVR